VTTNNPDDPGELFLAAIADRVAERLKPVLERPTQAERQQWFDVKGAAVYCGVSDDALRNAVKNGALRRHIRGERSVALHRDDLDRWMGSESSPRLRRCRPRGGGGT
jgi:excisionase family DNA binding protein